MLIDWERQELEALRRLVRLYSQRIEELEKNQQKLQREIETMQNEYGWNLNNAILAEYNNDQNKCNTSK